MKLYWIIFGFAVSFLLEIGNTKTHSTIPTLRRSTTANVLISFKEGIRAALNSVANVKFSSRSARLNTVSSTLIKNAEKCQTNVIEFLKASTALQFETLWISNQIYIKNANQSIINSLASFEEVKEIYEDEFLELDSPLEISLFSNNLSTAERVRNARVEWNIQKVNAPKVWEAGYLGVGVVVATIDSGVRHTHSALSTNYIGEYGWYDPYGETPLPNDQNGHGTDVMGLLAGTGGIGIAPRARWMSCKGCIYDLCSSAHLIKCGQWALCPTRYDSSDPDCTKAPHVINCSWGGGRNNQAYHPVIEAWRAAGIIPIFSNGNTGPSCDTARSPADHPFVIGTGATTQLNELAEYSRLGPTANNTIKPDFVAPGTDITSAYNTGDSDYAVMKGTSIAAPHVAGTVALLKSYDINLEFDDIYKYLRAGANSIEKTPGKNCGDISETEFPNHAVGNGEVDAYKSFLSIDL